MWEYKRINLYSKTPDEVMQIINELGEEGWEIIHYDEKGADSITEIKEASYFIIMKRLKPKDIKKQIL